MKYKKTKANKDRAERISATVEAYDEHDIQSSVIDILSDLRHYTQQRRIDFQYALKVAETHFEAEAGGEA